MFTSNTKQSCRIDLCRLRPTLRTRLLPERRGSGPSHPMGAGVSQPLLPHCRRRGFLRGGVLDAVSQQQEWLIGRVDAMNMWGEHVDECPMFHYDRKPKEPY